MRDLLAFALWLLAGVIVLGALSYAWNRWANRKGQR